MLNPADWPNDINALKALMWARDAEVAGLKAQLNTRAAEIEQLELQLEDLQADDVETEQEMPLSNNATPSSRRHRLYAYGIATTEEDLKRSLPD